MALVQDSGALLVSGTGLRPVTTGRQQEPFPTDLRAEESETLLALLFVLLYYETASIRPYLQDDFHAVRTPNSSGRTRCAAIGSCMCM